MSRTQENSKKKIRKKNKKINEKQIAKGYIIRICKLHRQAGSENAHQFLYETCIMTCHSGSQKAKETTTAHKTLLDTQDPRGYNQKVSDQDPRTFPDKQNCLERGM
jgi:hypothetical protein